VRLSPHPALQRPIYIVRLLPFALYVAFPRADYYGSSVAIGVAAHRRSRVPRIMNVSDDLRRSTHVLAPACCRRLLTATIRDDLTLTSPLLSTDRTLEFKQSSLRLSHQPLQSIPLRFSHRLCVPFRFPFQVSGMGYGVSLAASPCSLREQFNDAVTRRTVRCSTS
jgi:hypothetical protein